MKLSKILITISLVFVIFTLLFVHVWSQRCFYCKAEYLYIGVLYLNNDGYNTDSIFDKCIYIIDDPNGKQCPNGQHEEIDCYMEPTKPLYKYILDGKLSPFPITKH